jgi:hypothetical protein
MKNNKIKFIFTSEYGFNMQAARPRPSSSIIPDWFKNMEQYDDTDGIKIINGVPNATAKKCIPMLDSMTSGYTFYLWSDVLVSQDTVPEISWKVHESVFYLHGPSSRNIPAPFGYERLVFKYNSLLTARTPPGYSILVTSPMGHNDLPFKAVPAIIDTDKPTIDLSFPVWIKKDIKGVVEKGTPMVQIIPFKRESWVSEFDYMKDNEFIYHMDNNFNSKIKNHYLKKNWSKKDFK